MAADGMAKAGIAERTDATVTTVLSWRGRYQDRGIAGPRMMRPAGQARMLDHRQVLVETLKPSPKMLSAFYQVAVYPTPPQGPRLVTIRRPAGLPFAIANRARALARIHGSVTGLGVP